MISDAYDTYNRLKYHQQRVLPDQEFIDIYTQLAKVTKEQNRNLKKNIKYAYLNKRFLEKSRTLQRPKVTKNDLVGWLNNVYNLIPDNEFTTQQIYRYETDWQSYIQIIKILDQKFVSNCRFSEIWG
jgi:hypothetical protein